MKRRDIRYNNTYNSLPDIKTTVLKKHCPEDGRLSTVTLTYRKSCNEPCYLSPLISCDHSQFGHCGMGEPCVDDFYKHHQPD